MLRSMKALLGYTAEAMDETVGSVHDFYFDDERWALRYAVIDTGTFLPGRKVLISPAGLGTANWAAQTLRVNHTAKQVKESPSVDTSKPVSRQEEQALHRHYQWMPYWVAYGGPTHPLVMPVEQPDLSEAPLEEERGDPHLRSLNEVLGYTVSALDDRIGHVDDFIVETGDWTLRMFVVDTARWLPGKRVLLATDWIKNFNWHESAVAVDLRKDAIEGAPLYDPSAPVNEEVEVALYDYYGRPRSRT